MAARGMTPHLFGAHPVLLSRGYSTGAAGARGFVDDRRLLYQLRLARPLIRASTSRLPTTTHAAISSPSMSNWYGHDAAAQLTAMGTTIARRRADGAAGGARASPTARPPASSMQPSALPTPASVLPLVSASPARACQGDAAGAHSAQRPPRSGIARVAARSPCQRSAPRYRPGAFALRIALGRAMAATGLTWRCRSTSCASLMVR